MTIMAYRLYFAVFLCFRRIQKQIYFLAAASFFLNISFRESSNGA